MTFGEVEKAKPEDEGMYGDVPMTNKVVFMNKEYECTFDEKLGLLIPVETFCTYRNSQQTMLQIPRDECKKMVRSLLNEILDDVNKEILTRQKEQGLNIDPDPFLTVPCSGVTPV